MDKKLSKFCVVSFIALKSVGPPGKSIFSISKMLVQRDKILFVQ